MSEPLPGVAAEAGKGEIGFVGGSAVLTADYVVDLVGMEGLVFLQEAILATSGGSFGDEATEVIANGRGHRSAFALPGPLP